MDLPLVSIVIPAYNHASFVEEAIRSALEQTYPRIELLVFDDGSTDGTRKVIERVHRETGKTFRFVAKTNEGLVPTLNQGLGLARGSYFTQFGSDDTLSADSVARRVESLEGNPHWGLVCGDSFVIEDRVRTENRILGNRGRKYFRSADLYRELLLHNFVINLTVMYRKKMLVDVGGFDEAIPYFEDWDAVLRVAERHPIGYIDAPIGYYRYHSGNTHKRLAWMFTGILATMEKHFLQGRLAHHRWFRRHAFCRVHYQYGKRRFRAGDPPGAIESYLTALRFNPLYLRAYPKLLRAVFDRNRPVREGRDPSPPERTRRNEGENI